MRREWPRGVCGCALITSYRPFTHTIPSPAVAIRHSCSRPALQQ